MYYIALDSHKFAVQKHDMVVKNATDFLSRFFHIIKSLFVSFSARNNIVMTNFPQSNPDFSFLKFYKVVSRTQGNLGNVIIFTPYASIFCNFPHHLLSFFSLPFVSHIRRFSSHKHNTKWKIFFNCDLSWLYGIILW